MNKIMIIDDHLLFLHGLKLTLENENNSVTTFDSPIKALESITQIQPDLILMDLYMPEMSGLDMIKALTDADLAYPVVIISACEDYYDLYSALQKGAMGFIPKSDTPEKMMDGLDKVLAGELFLPPNVALEIDKIAELAIVNKQRFNLSERQLQILQLISEGKSNREIADILCISPDTVKFHQKGLYTSLSVSGSSSRLKAVEKALHFGLIKL